MLIATKAWAKHYKKVFGDPLTVIVQVEVIELSSGGFLSDVVVHDVGAELVQRDGVAQRLAADDQDDSWNRIIYVGLNFFIESKSLSQREDNLAAGTIP